MLLHQHLKASYILGLFPDWKRSGSNVTIYLQYSTENGNVHSDNRFDPVESPCDTSLATVSGKKNRSFNYAAVSDKTDVILLKQVCMWHRDEWARAFGFTSFTLQFFTNMTTKEC